MFVLAVILSVLVGIGFAYYIVAKQVYNSNNYGDYVGGIGDFARGTWDIVERCDYKTKKRNWTNDKILVDNQMRILRGGDK
ncbi:MAG: hypothetical protein E7289_00385 [Lachnospiraceae bacterium]|nr:hypothetical protein [Lachnospiraceae bacterium]